MMGGNADERGDRDHRRAVERPLSRHGAGLGCAGGVPCACDFGRIAAADGRAAAWGGAWLAGATFPWRGAGSADPAAGREVWRGVLDRVASPDRKSTRLNSSH